MRTKLTKIAHILSILIIGGIVVQTIISCSNDDSDGSVNNGSLSGNPEYEEWKEYLKYYDPQDPNERCQSGVTEHKCGDKGWFNPLNKSCSRDCSESEPDGSGGGCTYELGTIEVCGNELYVQSSTRRCQGGVLQRKCGDVWYNRETQYCDYVYDPNTEVETRVVKLRERCGSKYYIPDDYERCTNEVIEERCGWGDNVTWYNPDTHYCGYDNENSTNSVKALIRCGNEYIEPDYARCTNGVVEERCGSSFNANPTWYNEITQTCDWETGEVRNKVRCGS